MKKTPIFIAIFGILMLTLSPLVVSGENAEAQEDGNTVAHELAHRWDLVPWTGPDGTSVEEAFEGISQHVSAVWAWNNEDQSWSSYFPDSDPMASDLEVLTKGQPYWIATTQEGVVWEIPVVDDSDEETPTSEPTQENTPTPMPTDTPVPTSTPEPTMEPTNTPTATPTEEPTCGTGVHESLGSRPDVDGPHITGLQIEPEVPCSGEPVNFTVEVNPSDSAETIYFQVFGDGQCTGTGQMTMTTEGDPEVEGSSDVWTGSVVFPGEDDSQNWGYRLLAVAADESGTGFFAPLKGEPDIDFTECERVGP